MSDPSEPMALPGASDGPLHDFEDRCRVDPAAPDGPALRLPLSS